MDKEFLTKLNIFIGEASLKTYAGGGSEIDSSEVGFHELEHQDGDFYYKDSYSGHYQSSIFSVVYTFNYWLGKTLPSYCYAV